MSQLDKLAKDACSRVVIIAGMILPLICAAQHVARRSSADRRCGHKHMFAGRECHSAAVMVIRLSGTRLQDCCEKPRPNMHADHRHDSITSRYCTLPSQTVTYRRSVRKCHTVTSCRSYACRPNTPNSCCSTIIAGLCMSHAWACMCISALLRAATVRVGMPVGRVVTHCGAQAPSCSQNRV
jgi:hypothetical protein